MPPAQSDTTTDILIRRTLTEKVIMAVILFATTGSIGTSAYTSRTVTQGEIERNARLVVVEQQNKEDAKINEMVIHMAPMIERIDERTIQLQKSVDRLERKP